MNFQVGDYVTLILSPQDGVCEITEIESGNGVAYVYSFDRDMVIKTLLSNLFHAR